MNTKLFQKDFITTQDWTVEDLDTMLDLALRLKSDFATGVPHDHILRAKTLYMLFFEDGGFRFERVFVISARSPPFNGQKSFF